MCVGGWARTCVGTCMRGHVHVCMRVHVSAHMCAHVCVCVCVYMRVCAHVCICIGLLPPARVVMKSGQNTSQTSKLEVTKDGLKTFNQSW